MTEIIGLFKEFIAKIYFLKIKIKFETFFWLSVLSVLCFVYCCLPNFFFDIALSVYFRLMSLNVFLKELPAIRYENLKIILTQLSTT